MKLVVNNSFHVLGLESSASQKQVRSRVVEMGNLLKIEEVPTYDIDLVAPPTLRTSESIKQAQQNASSPERRLREYFFWFDVGDEVDQRAFRALKRTDFDEAIRVWEDGVASNPGNPTRRRNLGLAYLYVMDSANRPELMDRAIKVWNETLESEVFWTGLQKIYSLSDDLGTDPTAFSGLRKTIRGDLANCFGELYTKHGNSEYIAKSVRHFGSEGSAMRDAVVGPLVDRARKNIEAVVVILEDKSVKGEAFDKAFAELSGTIRNDFERANSLGMFDDAKLRTVRDATAEVLRSLSIRLNNENDYVRAKAVLDFASQVAATAGTTTKIANDVKTVQGNEEFNAVAAPIIELIEKKAYVSALPMVMAALSTSNNDLREVLTRCRRRCVVSILREKYDIAKMWFDEAGAMNSVAEFERNKKYKEASAEFEWIIGFVEPHFEIFNIDREKFQNIVSQLRAASTNLTSDRLTWFDNQRERVREIANGSFKGEAHSFEWIVYVLVLDSYIFSLVGPKMIRVRAKAQTSNALGKIFWNVFVFLVLLAIVKACH